MLGQRHPAQDVGGDGSTWWRRLLQWLRVPIGIFLAVILLLLGFRGLDWGDLARAIANVRWLWLVVAWATLPLSAFLKTLRWECLLGPSPRPRNLRRLLAIFAVGQMVNAAVPARLGEVSRAYLLNRVTDQPFASVLGSIVLEKLVDGLALLALVALLALQVALPAWFGTAVVSFLIVIVLLLALVLLIFLQRARLIHWATRLPRGIGAFVQTGVEGLGVLRQRGTLVSATGHTLFVWLVGMSTNYLVFLALDIEPSLLGSMFLVVAYYLAVLIPGVPAQIGLFHYVTILVLGVFGLERELSMSYAIVLHGLIYGTIFLLGIVSLSWLSLDLGSLLGRLRLMARGGGQDG